MARLFVGVPLVPFQTCVFQGSGCGERAVVSAVRELAPLVRCSGHLGAWGCPAMPNPQPLNGVVLLLVTTGVPPPCTVLLVLPTQPSVPLKHAPCDPISLSARAHEHPKG